MAVDEHANERCEPPLPLDFESSNGGQSQPFPSRQEMKHSRPKGQGIRPITQVFDDHHFPFHGQDSSQLSEERLPLPRRADLVLIL